MVTAGSRGDVEPYLALGEALAARGHRVRLLAPSGFDALFSESPVAYRPVGPDPRTALDRAALARLFSAGTRGLAFVRELIRAFREAAPVFLEGLDQELRGAERVVFSTLGFPAWHWAEAHGVPAVAAFLQPLVPTGAFPAPVGPHPRGLSRFRLYNRLTYWAAERMAWALVAGPSNAYRRRLGLSPLGPRGPFPRFYREKTPILLGFSPRIVPPPKDWPARVRVTGYWRRRGSGFSPPEALVRFLEAGETPVYVGFGSMRPPDPEGFFRRVFAALRLAGVRAVVARGWTGTGLTPPEHVFLVDEVPHSWLFPRVRAAVIHGGAGTSAAVFHAGIPSVFVPFLADQFFWAERARALGVAPQAVPAKALGPERLAAAIEAALRPERARRARALAERLADEDGAGTAARILTGEG